MRTIKVAQHISLDGFIQPGGADEQSDYAQGGWTAPYRTAEGAAALAAAYGDRYDLLLGRRTYDLWSRIWPAAKGGPFADKLNAAVKHVATHRPQGLEWGPAHDLGGDALQGVRRLAAQDGPPLLVCGSGTVASLLFAEGLVDELVLTVYPLLLGRGTRCFPEQASMPALALASSWATPTGVLLNTYRVEPKRSAP